MGRLLDQYACEIERQIHRGTSTSLNYIPKKIHTPKMKSIICENCGATLEVSKHPVPFRCEECRKMFYPCDRCKDVCNRSSCRFSDGEYYEEAVYVRKMT